jgi:hypothetical protein
MINLYKAFKISDLIKLILHIRFFNKTPETAYLIKEFNKLVKILIKYVNI